MLKLVSRIEFPPDVEITAGPTARIVPPALHRAFDQMRFRRRLRRLMRVPLDDSKAGRSSSRSERPNRFFRLAENSGITCGEAIY